jgi:4'-phosphopantetheinyl transferase
LNQTEATRQTLWPVLSPDEQQKVSRFMFAADGHKYLVARAILRMILGQYVQMRPEALPFAYSDYGKPYLQNRVAAQAIHFNVSHSGDLALYGITRNGRIGIDVEQIRPLTDEAQFVKSIFSPVEQQAFGRVRPSEKQEAFFNGWTRKEAFIKAIGLGLSFPLEAFDVSLAPGLPAQLLGVRGLPDSQEWSLNALTVGTEYKAAYVVEGRQYHPSYFLFSNN